jgi:peptidoglycan hydrolase-like protein with peptidoglycan-binding domain
MPVETTPLGEVQVLPFPNRVIKAGEAEESIVKAIQHRLNELGCGPVPEDGSFDVRTARAVKVFQARFADVTGQPLKVDGQVGSITWGVMFGASSVPLVAEAPSPLTKAALDVAFSQVGVMEDPLGSNRGPEVDGYLRAAGKDPAEGSFAWCVAFTHFCYLQASEKLGLANPHVKTVGVLDHWNKAKNKKNVVRITHADAVGSPALVKPGCLFIIDTGGGNGHSGMVAEVANGRLITVEGNTNDNGSRNGIGVFRRDARKINSINKGFIDYSAF